MSTQAADDRVDLSVPATTQHLRLVRLTASGMAADLGFDVDQIEDLRLAVDEACAVLVEHAAPAARLDLSYRADGATLVIDGRCLRANGAGPLVHPVVGAILGSTVDEYELSDDSALDSNTFRLVKHARR
jgi:serine/threonine-protein kinase RsbW